MGIETQRLVAADGSHLVVLRSEDFDKLLEAYEDVEDAVDGLLALRAIEEGDGVVPLEVLTAVLDEGLVPALAWRRYRGLSQTEVARRAGISAVWLGRIEAGEGHGKPAVRAALSAALDAPLWSLDLGQQQQRQAIEPLDAPRGFPSKSAEIRHLLAQGMSRADVARKVGVRYQFVRNVDVSTRES